MTTQTLLIYVALLFYSTYILLHWYIRLKAEKRNSSLYESPYRDVARHRRVAQWLFVCPYHKGTLRAYGITEKQVTRSEEGFHMCRVHWRAFCCLDSQSSFLRLNVTIQEIRRTLRLSTTRCSGAWPCRSSASTQTAAECCLCFSHSGQGRCGNHFSFSMGWNTNPN